MDKDLIIIGIGGHGKVVLDSILSNKNFPHKVKGFLDDGDTKEVFGLNKLGNIYEYTKYISNYKFHIAIGNNSLRKELALKIGTENLVSIFHKTSYISESSQIRKGSYIGAMSVINHGCDIGKNSIINTGTIIEHDTSVGECSHLSYRVLVGSNSHIEPESYIEMGEILPRGSIWRKK